MLFDSYIARRARCSRKDEQSCFDLIFEILDLADHAHRHGVRSLEEKIENLKPELLIIGLQLLVDGLDREFIKESLLTKIYFGRNKGKKLLAECLITDGVLAIADGYLRRPMEARFSFYLNKSLTDFRMRSWEESKKREERYMAEARKVGSERTLPGKTPLDKLLQKCSDDDLKHVISATETSTLVKSLVHTGEYVRYRMYQNLHDFLLANVCEDLDMLGSNISSKESYEAQKILSDNIRKYLRSKK